MARLLDIDGKAKRKQTVIKHAGNRFKKITTRSASPVSLPLPTKHGIENASALNNPETPSNILLLLVGQGTPERLQIDCICRKSTR
mmetsp:Transcript_102674/g.162111  ORF Transcript_102674/g.162111 Transcript_102674/m.162111 type:complete len:86 (-) Transcript_102674:961-1218(-)